MKHFTRADAIKTFGTQKGIVLSASLRRANLGSEKTITIQVKNNHGDGNINRIQSIYFFNTDECIKLFNKKIDERERNPFRIPNNNHIKLWKKTIQQLALLRDM